MLERLWTCTAQRNREGYAQYHVITGDTRRNGRVLNTLPCGILMASISTYHEGGDSNMLPCDFCWGISLRIFCYCNVFNMCSGLLELWKVEKSWSRGLKSFTSETSVGHKTPFTDRLSRKLLASRRHPQAKRTPTCLLPCDLNAYANLAESLRASH